MYKVGDIVCVVTYATKNDFDLTKEKIEKLSVNKRGSSIVLKNMYHKGRTNLFGGIKLRINLNFAFKTLNSAVKDLLKKIFK
jgi:hypothetical protein